MKVYFEKARNIKHNLNIREIYHVVTETSYSTICIGSLGLEIGEGVLINSHPVEESKLVIELGHKHTNGDFSDQYEHLSIPEEREELKKRVEDWKNKHEFSFEEIKPEVFKNLLKDSVTKYSKIDF